MCGIFGVLAFSSAPVDAALIDRAHAVQGHRGPDGRGTQHFAFEHGTLVLAHQRLAIIDLSQGGHQPMSYRDGVGSIVYNGELYNYVELREELRQEGEFFSTQSDTEVLLAALHRWGPAKALSRFNWMGAFAWYDSSTQNLMLARDAGSEKPLYYYRDAKQMIFASELKTLLTLAGRKFGLDRDVIGRFIHQGLSDTSCRTIFEDVVQLRASSYLRVNLASPPRQLQPTQYTPPPYPGDAAALSLPECIEEVRRLFIDSVRLRLRSDVPIGVLLSGGIDSSSIAAVTHQLLGGAAAPQLLSSVSDDARFDETQHIQTMERHLKHEAQRVVMRVSASTIASDLAALNWINDQPVSGLSALGHYRMMECAKQGGLKVIMSGQGADETFLGYRKYLGFYLQSLVRRGRWLRAAGVLSSFALNRSVLNQFDLGDAKRYLPMLRHLSGASRRDESLGVDGEWLLGWKPLSVGLGAGSLADRQKVDIQHLSVPALCHYEDRMSMAMSREIRLPFLDSRLVDLMLKVPDDYKLRNGWTKYCLREAMRPLLPPRIAWRRDKMGFSNPQGEWLKNELQQPVKEAFAQDGVLARKGIVNSGALLKKYARYREQAPQGGTIWYREIFAPFSLEIWMRQYAAWIS